MDRPAGTSSFGLTSPQYSERFPKLSPADSGIGTFYLGAGRRRLLRSAPLVEQQFLALFLDLTDGAWLKIAGAWKQEVQDAVRLTSAACIGPDPQGICQCD